MRFLCAAIGAACFALPAAALTLEEGMNWRVCGQDSECVLIEGVCGKTAVNTSYKNEASAFYRQQAGEAKCVQRFWEAKERIAECKPRFGPGGSNSGSCEAVAKPAKSKKKK